jgi:hypothetical protein
MEPASFTVVPLALFTMITILTVSLGWLAYKARQDHHETVRKSLELGQPLDPDVLKVLGRQPVTPEADQRGGLIAGSVGIAFLILAGFNFATGGDLDGTRVSVFFGILALGLGAGRLIAARTARKPAE